MVQERGTVHKARAVLEATRQAGVLVVYIVVNFRQGYSEIADRNVIFRERKTSARVPPTDPVSFIIPDVQPLPHESTDEAAASCQAPARPPPWAKVRGQSLGALASATSAFLVRPPGPVYGL